jgi:hypothetical protein
VGVRARVFCYKFGKNFSEPFQLLNQAYGEDWGKGLLDKKKTQMNWSKIKVMLAVFFDWKGIVHHEFVPRGRMVNKQFYQKVLVRRKRPEL